MDKNLIFGERYTNIDLMNMFHCKNSGGIRYSKETKTLILITNGTQKVYKDTICNGEILYVGEGLRGDQDIVRGNKLLYKARVSDEDVQDILFFESDCGVYTFYGHAYVNRPPYQEYQNDINGQSRKVWIFPLKIVR